MPRGLQLGVSLAGLPEDDAAPWHAGPRSAIAWAAAAGFPAVQLDGAAPGLRARELDRSARRDLASLLRRSALALCGIDLWIPPAHFADPARAERALDAALAALGLASDLAKLTDDPGAAVVALSLPANAELHANLGREAERRGVSIADSTPPPHPVNAEAAPPPGGAPAHPAIGVALDPAAALMAGLDPARLVAQTAGRLIQARLSDASDLGRVAPGSGRLDLLGYVAALAAAGYTRPVVLDLRALPDPARAAQAAASAWPGL